MMNPAPILSSWQVFRFVIFQSHLVDMHARELLRSITLRLVFSVRFCHMLGQSVLDGVRATMLFACLILNPMQVEQ